MSFDVTLKESSNGKTLIAVLGMWFQICGAAEETSRSVFIIRVKISHN